MRHGLRDAGRGGWARGEALVVRATPAPGWKIGSFNEDCKLGQPDLTVDTNCIVTFVPDTRRGHFAIIVAGPGSVTSDAGGIDCGTVC